MNCYFNCFEFDKVSEAMSPTTPTASSISPFHQSTSETQLRANYTLPYKRRGTIMKIIRKGRKVRSFGRADTKIKTRVPISQPRTKSGSEFFHWMMRLDQSLLNSILEELFLLNPPTEVWLP